ncbi:MAG: hypothetical protein PHR35_13685, partial [Kiritimatiellae bacterium]|nr:hypothetical protein [Kiritimatiellia bacterium]
MSESLNHFRRCRIGAAARLDLAGQIAYGRAAAQAEFRGDRALGETTTAYERQGGDAAVLAVTPPAT